MVNAFNGNAFKMTQNKIIRSKPVGVAEEEVVLTSRLLLDIGGHE